MTTPPETSMTAYIAEPIDFASGPSAAGTGITAALVHHGLAVYRPALAWKGGNHDPVTVEKINRVALLSADVVVANLQTGLVSYGTPMEIEAATAAGIPVVVLWPEGTARSVSLAANSRVTFSESWAAAVSIAVQKAEKHRANRVESTLLNLRPQLKFTMALGHETPRPGLADDCGLDLVTAVDTEIPPHSFVDIVTTTTGVQCPPGTWALITGRSSAIRKRGLLVPNGVIDHGWRGPLMAGVYNLSDQPVTVLAGERVAQVILMSNQTELAEIIKVDKLDPHERGLNGYGSTGGWGKMTLPERMDFTDIPRDTDGVIGTMTLCAPADPSLYQWDVPPAPPADGPPQIRRDGLGGWPLHRAPELPPAVQETLRGLADRDRTVLPDDMDRTERDEPTKVPADPSLYQWGSLGTPPAPLAELPAEVQGLLRGLAGRTKDDELESLRETVATLSDPGTMADLREAENDIKAGRLTTLDELPWASEGERLQALDGPGARPVDRWDTHSVGE